MIRSHFLFIGCGLIFAVLGVKYLGQGSLLPGVMSLAAAGIDFAVAYVYWKKQKK